MVRWPGRRAARESVDRWQLYFHPKDVCQLEKTEDMQRQYRRTVLKFIDGALRAGETGKAWNYALRFLQHRETSVEVKVGAFSYLTRWAPKEVLGTVLDAMKFHLGSQKVPVLVYNEIMRQWFAMSGVNELGQRMMPIVEIVDRCEKELNNPPSRNFWHLAMRAAAKCGDANSAEVIYHKWNDTGAEIRQNDLQLYVTSYSKSGNAYGTLRAMRTVLEAGMKLDDKLRTTLLGAFCRRNMVEEAEATLLRMESLDRVHFSLMLQMYARIPKVELLLSTVERMKSANVVPNAHTLNPVLHRLVTLGRLQDAAAIIELLKLHNIQPDPATYTILLQYYALKADLLSLEALLTVLRKPFTDIHTVNATIKALGMAGEYNQARKVFFGLGPRANRASHHTILRVLVEPGRMEEAFEIVNRMIAYGIERNPKTYVLLFSVCARAPSQSFSVYSAERALDLFLEDRMEPTASLLEAAAIAFHAERKPRYALQLLQILKRRGRIVQNVWHEKFCVEAVRLASLTQNPRDVLRVVVRYERLGLQSQEALRLTTSLALEDGSGVHPEHLASFLKRRDLVQGNKYDICRLPVPDLRKSIPARMI